MRRTRPFSSSRPRDGVAGSTRAVWDECAAVGMPRAIVVTHLDTARAGFDAMTEVCGRRSSAGTTRTPCSRCTCRCTARGARRARAGHRSDRAASRRVYDYASGERTERQPGRRELPAIEEARNRLIEGIIAESEDETLMDRYLGGEDLDVETLVGGPGEAVARGVFHPVLAAAPAADGGTQGLGTVELLELVTGGFPSPLERTAPTVTTPEGGRAPGPLACDPGGRWSPRW